MADLQLTCNVLECGKKLSQTAFVTGCSHIFCEKHGDFLMGRKECPACGMSFRKEYDFAQVDLNPSEDHKTMLLRGVNPSIAMEMARRSISFFTYQMQYTREQEAGALRQLKQQNEELRSYYLASKQKFMADLSQYQQTISHLQQELQEKVQTNEMRRQEIIECTKAVSELQAEMEMYKRELFKKKAQEKQLFSPMDEYQKLDNFAGSDSYNSVQDERLSFFDKPLEFPCNFFNQ